MINLGGRTEAMTRFRRSLADLNFAVATEVVHTLHRLLRAKLPRCGVHFRSGRIYVGPKPPQKATRCYGVATFESSRGVPLCGTHRALVKSCHPLGHLELWRAFTEAAVGLVGVFDVEQLETIPVRKATKR